MSGKDEMREMEAAIRDLDLDYMRGLVSEEEYSRKMADLRAKMTAATEVPKPVAPVAQVAPVAPMPKVGAAELQSVRLRPPEKKAIVDPVTAVKKTVENLRRIPIERIAQDAGVPTHMASRILTDLLDGRDLSGRVDHDSGDFILGTGTGPAPKTIAVCPYCSHELKRIAVKGETITCGVCRESFVVV